MSNQVNFSVDQGTDFKRILTFKTILDVPINMTGYTFNAQGRSNYSDKNPAFTFSFTVLDQVTNTGQVEMKLPSEQTVGLNICQVTEYVYDVERTSPTGDIDRILEGKIILNPEATK